jgi:hypothetical protein
MAFYDEKLHGFRVNPGPFQVLAGASSADIRSQARFEVVAKQP